MHPDVVRDTRDYSARADEAVAKNASGQKPGTHGVQRILAKVSVIAICDRYGNGVTVGVVAVRT